MASAQLDGPDVEQVRAALKRLSDDGRSINWIRGRLSHIGREINATDQALRDFIRGTTTHPHVEIIEPLRAACMHYSWHLCASDSDDVAAMYVGLMRFLRPEPQDNLDSATATYRVFIRSQEYNNYVVAGAMRIYKNNGMFLFEEFQLDSTIPVDEIQEGVVIRKGRNNYFISSETKRETIRFIVSIETSGGTQKKIPEFRGQVFGVSTNSPIYVGPFIMKLYDSDNSQEAFDKAKKTCYRKRIGEIPKSDKNIVSRLNEMKM